MSTDDSIIGLPLPFIYKKIILFLKFQERSQLKAKTLLINGHIFNIFYIFLNFFLYIFFKIDTEKEKKNAPDHMG